MAVTRFPDPRNTTPEGILALGGDLDPESLVLAYSQGIFPWPMPVTAGGEPELVWFCPPRRAVLEFDRLHFSTSFKRFLKKFPFRTTHNQAFSRVIEACKITPRPGQDGTWITPEIEKAYTRLHSLHITHSFEVWDGEALVGGIYGLLSPTYFSAESMFFRKSNASKVALLTLIEWLKTLGHKWLDIQVMTPHMKALGARTLSREKFLTLIRDATE